MLIRDLVRAAEIFLFARCKCYQLGWDFLAFNVCSYVLCMVELHLYVPGSDNYCSLYRKSSKDSTIFSYSAIPGA